ncbi:MAG: PIN domain-containing protein [Propionibacteriaceae bacterium]|jgi:predicted nucleic acid-binding protein|nr:PIN domain-containing protein [Propionibacteriaceae bacterium]
MILLDTGVLIDQSWPDDAEVGASVLSRAELEFGVAVARTPQDRADRVRRLADLDACLEWLPFDEAASRAYGALAALIRVQAPAQARRTDTFIAAQALQHGAQLMTTSPRDFAHIAHLVEVLPPNRPGPAADTLAPADEFP